MAILPYRPGESDWPAQRSRRPHRPAQPRLGRISKATAIAEVATTTNRPAESAGRWSKRLCPTAETSRSSGVAANSSTLASAARASSTNCSGAPWIRRATTRTSGPISCDQYTILDTRTDQVDYAICQVPKSRMPVPNTPDLHGVVGLFAYNPPMCLEVDQGSLQYRPDPKSLGFRRGSLYPSKRVLAAICHVLRHGWYQSPYRYAFESVRILACPCRRRAARLLPDGRVLDVPARSIRRAHVEAFWDELKTVTGTH